MRVARPAVSASAAAVLLALTGMSAALRAQSPSLFVPAEPGAGEAAMPDEGRDGPTPEALRVQGGVRKRPAWLAPAASALLPGSGQVLLRQARAVPYAAIEIYAVTQYLRSRRDARARRDDYRDLARDVARARFGGPKPVGNFEYYERLEHFVASGEFDRVPGGAVDPETDLGTFNGSIWLLARRTFWEDPEIPPPPESPQYAQAIQFYVDQAVGENFRWSWDGAPLEQDLFRRTIRRSNDAFRQASQFLGIVLANHALSVVDAIITVRLQHTSTRNEERIGFAVTLPLPGRN